MTIFNTETLLSQIQRALDRDDVDSAIKVLEALRPADQAHLVGELEPGEQESIMQQLDIEDAADILEKLEDAEAAELAQRLPSGRLASIADRMDPDEAADLLDDLTDEQADDVLASMESADEIRPLMPYPDDTAGGLMTTDFIALEYHMTVAQALEMVRLWEADTDMVHYLFVIDAEKLSGVVPLRRLIYADSVTPIQDLMDPDVISVHVEADQEECARLMSHYDLIALPVVNQAGHLLGIVAVDDVVDVLVNEATEDIQRLLGVQTVQVHITSAADVHAETGSFQFGHDYVSETGNRYRGQRLHRQVINDRLGGLQIGALTAANLQRIPSHCGFNILEQVVFRFDNQCLFTS
jgi:magnesium transporter